MDNPYRLSENDVIIIDTRLSALEEQTKSVTAWRRLAVVMTALTITAFAIAYVGKTSAAARACLDETIILGTSGFSSSAKASCSHPDHDSTVTSHDQHDVMIHCVCR